MTSRISRNQRQRAKAGFVGGWIAIVALLLLWQVLNYQGVFAFLAEWQFNFLGRSYPAVTYLLPVLILAALGLPLYWGIRRRQSAERIALATLRSALSFQKTLNIVAIASAVVALGFLLLSLKNSPQPARPQTIDLSAAIPPLPADGQATISGDIATTRTAVLRHKVLLTTESQRFAPITAPGSSGEELQFFVELTPAVKTTDGSIHGVLRRDALPGEIIRLYHYAGYRVASPHYVLFHDEASANRPYRRIALQIALIALVFALLALYQRRRVKLIERDLEPARVDSEET
ncbi:hypothetical protein EON83_24635 [bacterium]|nr:MAG: hypothetical protein EON83_24635 [bacterium]